MHSLLIALGALALPSFALTTCSPFENDVDYWGNDIGRTARASAEQCCDDCKATPGCRLFVWNTHEGGTCWLKNKQGARSVYPGAKASIMSEVSIPSQCPIVEEHVDYYGNDIASTSRSSADSCCADCASNPRCNYFVWNKHEGGTCWLKDKRGVKSFFFGAVAAPLAEALQCSVVEENVDYYGNDIGRTSRTSVDSCCDDCKKTPGCQLYVWNTHEGGTCWLKNKKGPVSSFPGAKAGFVEFQRHSTTAPPSTAPITPTSTPITSQEPTLSPTTPAPATDSPTIQPSTAPPTPAPTTDSPTSEPTAAPTLAPTTNSPTTEPTMAPVTPTPTSTTEEPTNEPTFAPVTPEPTNPPTEEPNNTSTPVTLAPGRDIRTLKYTAFELTYDCKERTALRWFYTMDRDTGSAKRPSSFYFDPNMPAGCLQQKSVKAYSNGYDRGHLVTSNHMDMTDATIHESHYMNNIVPQVSRFNQGIWAQTEVLQECYRDIHPVTTYGGVLYTDSSNDMFVDGWGIKTPDFFWKVVLTKDDAGADKIISWYIPNQDNLKDLDSYLVSVAFIESKLNDDLGPIPVPNTLKQFVASKGWEIPSNCDRG